MTDRLRLLLVPLVVLFAVAGVTSAAASPPTSGSGTFTVTSATFNSIRQAGGNTIIDLTGHTTYTGTFTGTSVVQGTLLFHADGSAHFHDVETFTGTVNGIPGTVTFNLNGGSTPDGVYHGTDVIISGTGGLTHLHGVLSQVGTVFPPPTTTTGHLHGTDPWRAVAQPAGEEACLRSQPPRSKPTARLGR